MGNLQKAETFVEQIDSTIALLVQQQEDGELFVEMDQRMLAELAAPVASVSKPSPRVKTVTNTGLNMSAKRAAKPAKAAVRSAGKKESPPAVEFQGVKDGTVLPDDLDALTDLIGQCTKCPLHQWRSKTVPGQGSSHPDILFIGEGPGKDEDAQGVPFVGRAGQVLTRMISKMGYTRDEVFIGNIVKCRPTVNNEGRRDRPPTPEEMTGCLPYLRKQIALLQPKVLVLLGNTAMEGLFGFKGITRRRGIWLEYDGIPAMPTFHPSYLLRNGGSGSEPFWQVWDDMCQVLEKLGREVPEVNAKRPQQSKLNI